MKSKSSRSGVDDATQAAFAMRYGDEFDLGAGEIAVGRDERQVIDGGRDDEVARIEVVVDERVVDRAGGGGAVL